MDIRPMDVSMIGIDIQKVEVDLATKLATVRFVRRYDDSSIQTDVESYTTTVDGIVWINDAIGWSEKMLAQLFNAVKV